jgi:hypothetical protein
MLMLLLLMCTRVTIETCIHSIVFHFFFGILDCCSSRPDIINRPCSLPSASMRVMRVNTLQRERKGQASVATETIQREKKRKS